MANPQPPFPDYFEAKTQHYVISSINVQYGALKMKSTLKTQSTIFIF